LELNWGYYIFVGVNLQKATTNYVVDIGAIFNNLRTKVTEDNSKIQFLIESYVLGVEPLQIKVIQSK